MYVKRVTYSLFAFFSNNKGSFAHVW